MITSVVTSIRFRSMKISFLKYSFFLVLFLLLSCSKDHISYQLEISIPAPKTPITKAQLSENQRGYVQRGNLFSLALLNSMYEGDNLFVSPLSVQFALGMATVGTDGETSKQITDALGYGSSGEVNELSKNLLEQLPFIDNNIKLTIANAVIAEELYPLADGFKSTINTYYYAAATNLPFNNNTLDAINSWANKSTYGMIPSILNSLPVGGGALILNTLYFKAPWATTNNKPLFDSYFDSKDDFNLDDGSVKKMEYMGVTHQFLYNEEDDFAYISIPFSDNQFSMIIFLPKIDATGAINNLIPQLSQKTWSELMASMDNQQVSLSLPKFEINANYQLKEPLQKLGVTMAFDPSSADFSKMFLKKKHEGYYLQDIIQKSHLNVTEWGTEAATTSTALLPATIATPDDFNEPYICFKADHPFVFIITESSSQVILFEGVFTGK